MFGKKYCQYLQALGWRGFCSIRGLRGLRLNVYAGAKSIETKKEVILAGVK